jgi:hypothetical protein
MFENNIKHLRAIPLLISALHPQPRDRVENLSSTSFTKVNKDQLHLKEKGPRV